jgi:ActR/RegA family two-component response regulator
MLEDRILIVDDDPSWQELLRESVEAVVGPGGNARSVTVAGSYAEAEALLARRHFHLAFVDLRLREEARELEGKQLARKITELDEGTGVVIATGHADVSTAITALKDWKVLDFILKDDWDPGKVAHLMQTGLPLARARYRARYESAVEFMRGERETYAWLAELLAALASGCDLPRPERRLGDFLNDLLAGLYPLLRLREAPAVALDAADGSAQACYWSKALGLPVIVRFGKPPAADHAPAACPAFARAERVIVDEQLGLEGVVYAPAPPDLAAFEPAQPA